jgi:hypothetical protein
MKRIGFLVASVVVLLSGSRVQADIEIRHEPITCVPMDRYARVSAKAVPAESVRGAVIQFRPDGASDWYSARMNNAGLDWSGLLPRPRPPLGRFEYRIVMTSDSGETSETPVMAVSVTGTSSECRTLVQTAADSPIVVTVPAGAPLVPPVPTGFNPVGVATDQQQVQSPKGGFPKWALIGGLGVAGGVGAAVALSGKESHPPAADIPTFSFQTTFPRPGSTISLGDGELIVVVHMSHKPRAPVNFEWFVEMRSESGQVCLAMADRFRGASEPLDLSLTAPFQRGNCGATFGVTQARIVIWVGDAPRLDTTIAVPFRFEP